MEFVKINYVTLGLSEVTKGYQVINRVPHASWELELGCSELVCGGQES